MRHRVAVRHGWISGSGRPEASAGCRSSRTTSDVVAATFDKAPKADFRAKRLRRLDACQLPGRALPVVLEHFGPNMSPRKCNCSSGTSSSLTVSTCGRSCVAPEPLQSRERGAHRFLKCSHWLRRPFGAGTTIPRITKPMQIVRARTSAHYRWLGQCRYHTGVQGHTCRARGVARPIPVSS
jgi:hypothetical protein